LARTTIVADPEFDEEFPARRQAVVTLRLADGSELTRRRRTRKGDPDDPLTDGEMRAKFDDVVVPEIGAEAAAELSGQLWNLRGRASLSALGSK